MELRVEQYQLPSTITANWDEIKVEISAKLKDYSVMVYTDDQISRAKADKAYLNKLKKAINDERIRLEREYMKPFDDFKAKAKEVIALIEEPIAKIDEQIKAADEKRKEMKQLEIGSLFACAEFPSWVRLSMIMKDKWLNATYKSSDIKDELEVMCMMIKNNVKTLESLDYGFEALEEYKRTLDFNKALEEGRRLSEMQKRKKEQIKEPVIEVTEDEPTTWKTFGGFFTDKQIKALYEWCEERDIMIVEV